MKKVPSCITRFFSKRVKATLLNQRQNSELFNDNTENQTLTVILNYMDHQSINIIQTKRETKNTFTFVEVNTKEIEKDIRTFNSKRMGFTDRLI